MRSVVQNRRFDFSEFSENARQCIIFSITICTFHTYHVMLIPQAPLFYMCFGTQICVFFTNFTLRTLLKRQYSVSLTFWVWNRSGIVGFNQKRTIFFKNYMFGKICVAESKISRFMCSAVQNPRFDFSEFTENARQCIIFSIAICTFYPAHGMLIPQALLFYMCFGTQICVFSRISRSARIWNANTVFP